MSILILVGSAIPNSLSGNAILPAEQVQVRHNSFYELHYIAGSVDIGLIRPIEVQKPLAVMIPESRWGGQCLAYIQKLKGYKTKEFSGYPNRISPNETEPKIGYAVLTTEGNVGHIALIKNIENNKITLLESNYRRDEMITDDRQLNVNSKLIRGYYKFD